MRCAKFCKFVISGLLSTHLATLLKYLSHTTCKISHLFATKRLILNTVKHVSVDCVHANIT